MERSMSASSQCPHSDIHYHLNHHRSGDTNLMYLEITAKCSICNGDMAFRGAPMGSSPNHPAMSPDGKEMRLPFLCEGEDLTGKPIGFTISGFSA
jgi:hypothetical protein